MKMSENMKIWRIFLDPFQFPICSSLDLKSARGGGKGSCVGNSIVALLVLTLLGVQIVQSWMWEGNHQSQQCTLPEILVAPIVLVIVLQIVLSWT